MQNAQVLRRVIGTRPEAIKLAPMVLALHAHPQLSPVVVTTGQHRQTVAEVLDLFDIEPDEDLAVDDAGRELSTVMGAVLARLGAGPAPPPTPASSWCRATRPRSSGPPWPPTTNGCRSPMSRPGCARVTARRPFPRS